MKVKVTYLSSEPTRDRRPGNELDYVNPDTAKLDARFVMKFDASSIYDVYQELVDELYIDNDDSVETLEDLKDFLELNNEDVSYGNDLIETITIDGKLIFKDEYITDIINDINEDFSDDEDDYSVWDYISGDVKKGRVDVIPLFVDGVRPNRFTPPCDPNFNRLVFDTPDGKLVIRATGFFEHAKVDSTATLDGEKLIFVDYGDDYVVFTNNKYLLLFSIKSDGDLNRIGAFLYRKSAVPKSIIKRFES